MFGKKKLAAAAVTTNPAPAEGTDWIPEGGLTPVHVEESAEAEIAPYQNTWEKFWSIFKHNKVALVSLIVIILYSDLTIDVLSLPGLILRHIDFLGQDLVSDYPDCDGHDQCCDYSNKNSLFHLNTPSIIRTPMIMSPIPQILLITT